VRGWAASRVTDLPFVSDLEPDDPVWYPLQHALGIDTFGANVFVAERADQLLVEEHDERESGQQELYLLLDGSAVFELDGEETRVERGDALAVIDPGVRRRARALAAGTTLLVVGSSDGPFESTWNAAHFSDLPRPN
jgi:mannose-6-phosphate isomerase-like protein (cupin superfamily)